MESFSVKQNVRRLACHIIIKALEDLQNPKQQEDAQIFFASKDFDILTRSLGFSPQLIRESITAGIDTTLLKNMRRAHKNTTSRGAITKRTNQILHASQEANYV